MKNLNLSKSPKFAAFIAGLLLLFFNAAYYSMKTPVIIKSVIPSDSLNSLPLQIASWNGQDVPIDKEIIPALDYDAYINRVYTRSGSTDSVMLFFACSYSAYYNPFHQPEVCYPANGWTLMDEKDVLLQDGDRLYLPCTVFNFSRGDMKKNNSTVLNYYISDGQIYGNRLQEKLQFRNIFKKNLYFARVMISTSAGPFPSNSASQQIVLDFAKDSALFISSILNDIEKSNKDNKTFNKPDKYEDEAQLE